jgi:L-fuculose-phosphate aldolase
MPRDLRAELVRHYRLLREHGVNDSHSGNGSVRDGDAVWVTPTGACADTLTRGDLVRCDLRGGAAAVGTKAGTIAGASLDAPLHLAVYRRNPAARAVLHSHGPHAIALTLDGRDFVPIDFEGAFYFPRVPVVEAQRGDAGAAADYVAQSPELVAAALAAHKVCIYRGHGVYAWGEDLDRAYKWSCSVEASARIAWLARVAGVAPPA